MQQIADWLEKLGLSEYTARFAENGIDISVLRYLTDQDLKDIGVLLGHRRKMLAAIRTSKPSAPTISARGSAAHAEGLYHASIASSVSKTDRLVE